MGSSISRNRHVLCKHVLLKEWDRVIERASTHPHEARYVQESGYTALHFACYLNAPPKVVGALLTAHPAATTAREDIKGLTPLHIACYFGRDEAARLLIEADVESVEVRTDANSTPLDLVCIQMHKQFVAASIATGGGDEEDWSSAALRFLVAETNRESSRYVAIATCLVETLHCNGRRGARDAIKSALRRASADRGKTTNANERDGTGLVHACAEMVDVPSFLLHVAMAMHPEQLRRQDSGGNLPLHLALRGGRAFDVLEAIVHASPCAVMETAGCGSDEETTVRREKKNGLYPFMQAAVDATPFSPASLDAIYLLLRTCPELERFGYGATAIQGTSKFHVINPQERTTAHS